MDKLRCLLFEANAAHLFFRLVSTVYERGWKLVTSDLRVETERRARRRRRRDNHS